MRKDTSWAGSSSTARCHRTDSPAVSRRAPGAARASPSHAARARPRRRAASASPRRSSAPTRGVPREPRRSARRAGDPGVRHRGARRRSTRARSGCPAARCRAAARSPAAAARRSSCSPTPRTRAARNGRSRASSPTTWRRPSTIWPPAASPSRHSRRRVQTDERGIAEWTASASHGSATRRPGRSRSSSPCERRHASLRVTRGQAVPRYGARMTTRARLAGLVDTALEASVIGGFSRIGPLVRGRLEHWADPPSLDGRVCLVTGASGGLGLAASTGLARLGASLRLLVRDAGKGEDARRRIVAETGNEDVRCELVDLSLRRSVRACAERLLAAGEPVHVLVHNAGVLPAERTRDRGGSRADVRDERARAAPAHAPAARAPDRERARARPLRLLRRHVHAPPRRRRPAVARAGRSTAASPTRAASAPRSCSRSAGRRSSPAPASSCTRCTRAGPTRRASRPRSRRSGASCGRCCARPSRAPTRSSGWPLPPSPARSTGRFWSDRHVALHALPLRAHARDGRGARSALARARRARGRGRGADMIMRGND